MDDAVAALAYVAVDLYFGLCCGVVGRNFNRVVSRPQQSAIEIQMVRRLRTIPLDSYGPQRERECQPASVLAGHRHRQVRRRQRVSVAAHDGNGDRLIRLICDAPLRQEHFQLCRRRLCRQYGDQQPGDSQRLSHVLVPSSLCSCRENEH